MDGRIPLKSYGIGMVVNTTVKPSRDVMLGIIHLLRKYPSITPRFFHASGATSPENLVAFAAGLDGLIFCGVLREVVRSFLRLAPHHPPLVLCTYAPLAEGDRELLGLGGTVMLDNEAVGRMAADFFLDHGLQSFAFFGSNVYRERLAGQIRCEAFRARIDERLGGQAAFSRLMLGHLDEATGDFWEPPAAEVERWIESLPLPCGVFVNGDREAYNLLNVCSRAGIDVPDKMEVLGINNVHGFCEQARPTISSIFPDYFACARQAVKMALELISDPELPPERCDRKVSALRLVERGSTASGRDYGHVVARAREFIRLNACGGIDVPDVAAQLGVSRRMLEKRVRDATGQSVLEMIQKVRLENVCRLLEQTDLSITEVTLQSGYELTSNLGKLFKRKFGMTMRAYRTASRKV